MKKRRARLAILALRIGERKRHHEISNAVCHTYAFADCYNLRGLIPHDGGAHTV